MKFTTVAADAFQKFQLNAGILLTEFDPTNPTVDRTKIFAATSGGASFSVSPEFVDFGDDVDNVPANTKQLKVLQSVTAVMSGTLKTADTMVAKRLMAAADVQSNGKIIPRADLKNSDFFDLWWVGDYSDVNVDSTGNASNGSAGFMAIKLINALSTGGFSLQSNDKSKGDFSFEFTGHYDINDMTVLPYEVYIQSGTESTSTVANATLSALTIGTLTLDPAFDSSTTEYTVTTENATNTVTATATDPDAGVVIVVNGNSVTSGTSVTWENGENAVVVTVTNDGQTETYTVTVTASVE